MPIELAPISRRRFIAGSLAAGAGLALSPAVLADSAQADPKNWALLSDIHLAADRSFVFRGANMASHFNIVARELLAFSNRPARLLVTGDCAYSSGEPGDYVVFADLLEPIRKSGIPVHLALGNHDNRDRFWDAFREEKAAKRPLPDKQVSLVQTEHANWFILDSLETTSSTPGLLGREQLDWLACSLDANPDKPALVIIHHNPGISGNLGLKDTLLLYEVIRPRRQVKAYIYGHTHSWRIEQDVSGIHLINLPAVSYTFMDGEPTGWVHARIGEEGIRLELRCVDTNHKAHGEVKELKWRI